MVVNVADDAGGAPVLAREEHADARHQHDAGHRVAERGAGETMLLEVARVIGDEAIDGPLDRLRQLRRRLRAGRVHEARHTLGVDRVVGRGRSDLGDARRVDRRDEVGDLGRVVERHHDATIAAEQAAEPGRHRQRRRAARRRLRNGHPRSAEEPPAPLPLGDRRLGASDQIDRRLVGLAHRGAPRDRAVALEQERFRVRPLADRVGHVARDAEPGATVREREHVLAVHAVDHVGRPIVVGQRHDRVGVGVDDRGRREEAVQERLDRGPDAAGLLERVAEVAHHLLVAHVVACEERADIVHAHAREILALDRLEVGAGALDPEHADLAAAMIVLTRLDRRVAAAPDHQRGFGADQAGRVDEEVEALEPTRLRLVPA